VVIGGLELLDTVVSRAPADIAPQPWSPSAALGGVVRVVGLAAIGAMITAVVLGVRPRLPRWTRSPERRRPRPADAVPADARRHHRRHRGPRFLPVTDQQPLSPGSATGRLLVPNPISSQHPRPLPHVHCRGEHLMTERIAAGRAVYARNFGVTEAEAERILASHVGARSISNVVTFSSCLLAACGVALAVPATTQLQLLTALAGNSYTDRKDQCRAVEEIGDPRLATDELKAGDTGCQ